MRSGRARIGRIADWTAPSADRPDLGPSPGRPVQGCRSLPAPDTRYHFDKCPWSSPLAAGQRRDGSIVLAGRFLIWRDASLILCDAPSQRVHEVDEPAWRRKDRFLLPNGARLFRLEVSQECLLVAVPEGHGVEGSNLAVHDMLGEFEQVRRECQLRHFGEVIRGVAHLRGVAKGRAEEALAIWLQRDHVFALGQDTSPERHHEVLAFGDLVAAAFLVGRYGLAGFLVDQLLAQAMAGRFVNLPEGNALGRRAGGMQRDLT